MEKYDYIGYQDVISHLDIKEGDTILVASDILKFICLCRENNEIFDPNIFIDTVISKIGKTGTLLFPTYNWDFCKGEVFDYRNSAGQVGALGNVALQRKDFKRTKHPIYSFAVWGYQQDFFCRLSNISAFGADSPFAYLCEKHAKHLFIGVDYKYAFTHVHYFEEKVGVYYRYFKDFTAPYREENGVIKTVTYRMYVRKLEFNIETAINPLLDDVLLREGCYTQYLINDVSFGMVDLWGISAIMENDIRIKGGMVYPKAIK